MLIVICHQEANINKVIMRNHYTPIRRITHSPTHPPSELAMSHAGENAK